MAALAGLAVLLVAIGDTAFAPATALAAPATGPAPASGPAPNPGTPAAARDATVPAAAVPEAAVPGVVVPAAAVPGVVVPAALGVAAGAGLGGAPAAGGALPSAGARLDLGGFRRPAPGVDVTAAGGRRTMTTRQLPTAQFAAVGVTWRAGAATGTLAVTLRVRTPAGDWGPWRRAAPSTDRRRGAGAGTARAGTDLVWVGSAAGVQVSIAATGGSGPADVAVELIDPAHAVGDATAGVTASGATTSAAAGAMPVIVARAGWRADESVMTWRTGPAGSPTGVLLRPVDAGSDYGQSEVPAMLRALYRYHATGLGWGDLGYHVLIDRFGRIWQGRSGGVARPTPTVRPAAGAGLAAAGARPLVVALLTGEGGQVTAEAAAAATRYLGWRLATGPVLATRRVVAPDASAAAAVLAQVRAGVVALLGERADPAAPRGRLATWRASDATWWLAGPGAPAPGTPATGAAAGDSGGPVLTGTPGDLPAPADYDGDGLTDVAVWTPATGGWRYLGTATGSIGTATLGAPGDLPVPADYDGDGRAEPATWNPATGGWRWPGAPSVRWGRAGDIPLPGDYDGDGRAEPAVWRPGTGRWYLRGTGVLRLGSRGGVPVPADYDGDGVPEPAVWSPGSGRWFVAGRRSLRFGAPGDQPVPWQYDGDGRAEPAVVHQAAAGRLLLVRGGPALALPDQAAHPVPLN